MKTKFYLFVTITLLAVTKSFAWGEKGHSLVAEVAFHYLDDKTKATIMSYLDGMNIEDAANWMDAIKTDPKNKYMSPWHYVNFEKGSAVVETSGDNILFVLDKTISELKNRQKLSKDEIKTRILYLFHLIGDLHQPLHVGYASDKGGNNYQLNYKGKGTNLHSFWDSGIIKERNITLQDCLDAKQYSPAELKALQKTDVVAWAVESRSFLDGVYNTGNKVNDGYVDTNSPIIEVQILKAGIRLAGTLESVFKD
ncbi:endonuclease [Flavobacterium noncentrifugens]|uniref:S1/P1 Nuclease n=1 Tax=Flavobacterium noncentrifugens TaxID=1128970 RepID=A0A1G8SGJ1_9FLAO|nr:S1/P1 nuclease [Flavobacterium noncentrifugens]GEP49823.1 endonuclease [Flavobacterium noncentrifugens]SDJ28362.1 S1/P1 Nuclease [Flavobacterium noncentrifugens]